MSPKMLSSIIVVLVLIISACLLFGEDHLTTNIVQDRYFQRIIYHSYRPGAINEQGIAYQNLKSEEGFDVYRQQICWDAIVTGIGKGQEKDISLGLKAIQYSFEKMRDDGSFENSPIGGAPKFLLAFAKSYYEIEKSAYKEKYLNELNSYLPKLKKATYYIFNSPQWKREKTTILDCSNQAIAMGLTFNLLGIILKEQKITEEGNKLFYQGLNQQTKEGIFPEKGGYDSSYQAVSLQFIEFYYLYAADNKEKETLLSILEKGWAWELKRIEDSGRIKVEGNTRTGLQQEMWHGKFKDVNYAKVALTLIYWSHISKHKDLRESAMKIFDYGLKYKK